MISSNGKLSPTERLIRHNDNDEHINFPVLDCMTVEPHIQPSSPLFTFEKVNSLPETPAPDSEFWTELGNTNDNMSDPHFINSPAPQASSRRSTRNIETINYRKAHTGRSLLSKTSSSVPIHSPHSAANQAIRNYMLSPGSQIKHTSTLIKGFLRIARKKAEVSTPDEPSLKDAMASSEAERWQEAMEIEYEALSANGT